MGRYYTFPAFDRASTARYIVLWDLQWQVIESQRLEPSADLSEAMAAAIERIEGEGWQTEATPDYGFVFIQRAADRRLLMITERDPADASRQSFTPFRSEVRFATSISSPPTTGGNHA
jgi:hypothetical protein